MSDGASGANTTTPDGTSAADAPGAPPPAAAAGQGASGETKPAASSGASIIDGALKPDATKAADGKTDAKPEDTKPAPIELKLPEGAELEAGQVDAFKAVALEVGLDSAKAQKLFDHYLAIDSARAKATEAAIVAQEAKWQAEVQADPDLGGPKMQATVAEVRRAVGFVGRPLGELLAKSGLGSHPDVVRALAKVGRALADDTIQGTANALPKGAPAKKSDAQIF